MKFTRSGAEADKAGTGDRGEGGEGESTKKGPKHAVIGRLGLGSFWMAWARKVAGLLGKVGGAKGIAAEGNNSDGDGNGLTGAVTAKAQQNESERSIGSGGLGQPGKPGLRNTGVLRDLSEVWYCVLYLSWWST
jgi:hypothetical protein